MILKSVAAFTLFFLSFTSCAQQFDSIVVFGDSLSDNGNLYNNLAHIIPQSPPYYEGRFSNGPVWVEKLFQAYYPNSNSENFRNFAVGGAGAVISYKQNLPYTLTAEVDNYLYFHRIENAEKALYIVWIGANNYLNAPTNVEAITTDVVNAIGSNVERLIKHGGVTFMIVNLPDLDKVPSAAVNGKQELLSQISTMHNTKLLEKYNQLKQKYPNVTFVYFDIRELFDLLLTQPQQFSITNTSTPCYTGGFIRGISAKPTAQPTTENLENYLDQQAAQNDLQIDEQTKQAILQNPVLREALDVGMKNGASATGDNHRSNKPVSIPNSCTGFVFWDHVHPTTYVHEIISQHAKTALDNAGIEPVVK